MRRSASRSHPRFMLARLLLAAAAIAMLAASPLPGGSSTGTPALTFEPVVAAFPIDVQADAVENASFTVTIRSVRFSVGALSAEPGQNITLTLRNDDPVEHTFTLFADVNASVPFGSSNFQDMIEFNNTHAKVVDIQILPGQTVVANFTAPTAPGQYTFVCMIMGH